ncbi:YaiO family outer membrane beta-barrel protein [uncultured Eudoraea sp.]|uniref:YaiO family outer membrane beta-barrel protein n=1 Tax=uncultured Eudoraea sp. TaxID=1035614 RepID=UPI00261A9565|nr:YaiO family outer membrane beta-barrel protein [uncultured Eudoraea sp.]
MLFLLFFLQNGKAQELAYHGNPDESFYTARDLAFEGDYGTARDTLQHILSKYPDYSDVRNLLAKTYSWDGNHNEARKHFNKITSTERTNKEAWIAAIKNEIYADNHNIALGLTNKALIYIEDDADLKVLGEEIKNDIFKKQKALDANAEEKNKESDAKNYKNRIGIISSVDAFDIVYDPMIYSSAEYIRETKIGRIIPRINYANRFNTNGLQYEMDFYPRFSKTFYAYTNYGYSNSQIFPNHRAGAELYANLPKAIEVSGGIRYLDFVTSQAIIYTGSFGLYKGNYYFSLRPYLTPRPDGPIGFSGSLLARKYYADRENYFGINLIMGYSPEIKQLISNSDVVLAETLLFVESQQLLFEYQFTGKSLTNSYRASLGLTRQELVFDPGEFFYALSAGFRYHTKF